MWKRGNACSWPVLIAQLAWFMHWKKFSVKENTKIVIEFIFTLKIERARKKLRAFPISNVKMISIIFLVFVLTEKFFQCINQANWAISTGQLHALPRFHIQPINVVVYYGSIGRTSFEVSFPLRCFQRLSFPYLATRHCGWRHNRSTSGMFIPVLSY